jgi:hypothetical protein
MNNNKKPSRTAQNEKQIISSNTIETLNHQDENLDTKKPLSRAMRLGRWCAKVDEATFNTAPNYYVTIGYISLVAATVISIFVGGSTNFLLGGYSIIAVIVAWFISVKLVPTFWYWYQGEVSEDKEWASLSLECKFGIWASGADFNTIKEEKEFSHYKNVGWTVFSAALLSSIASGYAINSIWSEPFWLSILAGFLWGFVIIMNIDRLLISTFNKAETPISFRNIWSLGAPLVRIALSILISISISYPLEIAIFKNQIKDVKDEIVAIDLEKYKKIISKTREDIETKRDSAIAKFKQLSDEQADWTLFSPEAQRLISQQTQSKQRLDLLTERNRPTRAQIETEKKDAYKSHTNKVYNPNSGEMEFKLSKTGTNLVVKANERLRELNESENGEKRTFNDITKSINDLEAIVLANKDILKAQAKLDMNNQQEALKAELLKIDTLIKEKQGKIKTSKDGLPGDIEALHHLEANNNSIWWTGKFLMLIFITIELLPFLAKFSMPATKYDENKAKSKRNIINQIENEKDLAQSFHTKQKQDQSELMQQKHEHEMLVQEYKNIEKDKAILLQAAEDLCEIAIRNIKAAGKVKAAELAVKHQIETEELQSKYAEKIKQINIDADAEIEKLKTNTEAKIKKLQEECNTFKKYNPEYEKLLKEKIALEAIEQKQEIAKNIALGEKERKTALHEHEENLKKQELEHKKILEQELLKLAQTAETARRNLEAEYNKLKERATTREIEFFVQQQKLADAYLKDYKTATESANKDIIAATTRAQKDIADRKINEWKQNQ